MKLMFVIMYFVHFRCLYC